MVTGRGSFEVDMDAMQVGAMDYISKSEITPALLERSIRYAIERRKNQEALNQSHQRLQTLIQVSGLVQSARSLPVLLETIVDGARSLTGAQVCLAGYLCGNGQFQVGATSCEVGRSLIGLRKVVEIQKGGVYLDLMHTPSLRLTEQEMVNYSIWWGLPEQHVPLRGLLGARMVDMFGQPNGLIVVSDRNKDEFTAEDEALLIQLAALASLSLQHIQVLGQANQSAEELAQLLEENRHQHERLEVELAERHRLETWRIDHLAVMEVQRRLIQQREMERLQIAHDLHEGPLQDMIATNFALVEAMGIQEKEPRLAKMRFIQSALHKNIQDIRVFCSELRPPALAPFGLERAIRSHLDTFKERNPALRVIEKLMPDGKLLPEDIRMALYRIYQESINNISKHASASQVNVALDVGEVQVTLRVEDNGVGFSIPSNWTDFARLGYLGLIGMRERANTVGGVIEINSNPGLGTFIQVSVPVQSNGLN